jgi:hypothetical protein
MNMKKSMLVDLILAAPGDEVRLDGLGRDVEFTIGVGEKAPGEPITVRWD